MPQDNSHLPAALPANGGVDTYRQSTNAATLCGEIVKATAQNIQGRKYVRCEGWQSIAIAHGCTASACDVERVDGGFRATGQVRRMDTGAIIAESEGFVGEDEPTWFGGKTPSGKVLPKRPDFAIRAMAQTRAISRACRSAFAHVVVMIDRSLGTMPAEEMQGVIDHDPRVQMSNPRDFIEDAVADGLVVNGDTRSTHEQTYVPVGQRPDNVERTKKKVDAAIGTFALSGQSVETLDAFWKSNAKEFGWIEKHIPAEYERLKKAYDDARDAAEARV